MPNRRMGTLLLVFGVVGSCLAAGCSNRAEQTSNPSQPDLSASKPAQPSEVRTGGDSGRGAAAAQPELIGPALTADRQPRVGVGEPPSYKLRLARPPKIEVHDQKRPEGATEIVPRMASPRPVASGPPGAAEPGRVASLPVLVKPPVSAEPGAGPGPPRVAKLVLPPGESGPRAADAGHPWADAQGSLPSGPRVAESGPPAAEPSPPPSQPGPSASGSIPAAERPVASSGSGRALGPSKDGDYIKMKVYYGTDRAAVDTSATGGLSPSGWFYLTALAAGVTMTLAALAYRYSTSRLLLGLSACGLAVTAVLGLVTSYARSRPVVADSQQRRSYGNERGSPEMGACEVSIPKTHEVGVLEGPSILRFELTPDPLRHVVVLDVKQQAADEFYKDLQDCVARSAKNEAFVFVHGYNISFDNAARRTAQIAYDLKFDGAPIFFSWPSQGELWGYTIDETNVVWSVPHLKEFLVGVARRSGAGSVHLIAHSMGNRALTAALHELFYELDQECPRFREIVLTAPDIDAEVFQRDLAPAIVKTAQRVTLYASSNDEALVLSKRVHGYARAGDSGGELVVVPGMDTIDVSAVDTSLIGHSYYSSNDTVLADLFELLHDAKPPDQRKYLRAMQLGQFKYWMFMR